MIAHDVVTRLLSAEGVDTIFTLMSEDTMTMMSKFESNWSDRIRMVKTRHEQGAMAMADGYSRTTGDIGVCLVGRGPAISQTGNAMVTARKKDSDLLVIVPESPLSGRYDIKNFEQTAFLRSTIGTVVSIRDHDTLIEEFTEALRRVRIGDGPLAVQIPWDVLDGEMDVSGDPFEGLTVNRTTTKPRTRCVPDKQRISEAVDMYVDSAAFKPPVVLVGRGAIAADAQSAIEDFAARTSAVLVTSLQARNYFSDHPFSLGIAGSWGTNLANEFTSDADIVFAVGASLNPYTIDHGHVFGPETSVVHIDQDPARIGKHVDVDLGLQGDARFTIEALIEELERREIHREGELWSEDLRGRVEASTPMTDREYPTESGTVDPRELVTELDELLPDEKKLVLDGGHFTRWCIDGIQTPPEDLVFTLDFSSIGLGLPIGVGTAVASDKPCVTICGDAGFMMSIQELETAVRHDIPVMILVMNDSSLGSEYHTLDVNNTDPTVALVSTPEFAKVATSMGANGETVRSIDELHAVAETLGSKPSGPVVIDCKVNRHVRHRTKT